MQIDMESLTEHLKLSSSEDCNKSILEYLNRSSRKPIGYGPVQLHYSNGKPDGVEILDGKCHFVLSLEDWGTTNWNTAVDKTNYRDGIRLATREEWEVIGRHLDEVNHTLKEASEDLIDRLMFWTSESYSASEAWCYSIYHNKVIHTPKTAYLIVRPVKDI